jgi:hypothetical protein
MPGANAVSVDIAMPPPSPAELPREIAAASPMPPSGAAVAAAQDRRAAALVRRARAARS